MRSPKVQTNITAVPDYYFPTPSRADVCGLFEALSLTCNDPVRVPVCVGVKTTLIVQLVLAARLVEQVVLETLKSPVVPIEMLVRATFCLLARVKAFAALVVPTFCEAYTRLVGDNVAWGSPLPLRGTVWGLPEALSAMVTAPVRAPT